MYSPRSRAFVVADGGGRCTSRSLPAGDIFGRAGGALFGAAERVVVPFRLDKSALVALHAGGEREAESESAESASGMRNLVSPKYLFTFR